MLLSPLAWATPQNSGTDLAKELSSLRTQVEELEASAQYAAAAELAARCLELHALRDPPSKWWKTSDYQRKLEILQGISRMPPPAQRELAESGKLTNQWRQANREGRYHRAVELARQQYRVRLRLLGEEHGYTVVSLHILANSLQQAGRLAESELLGRRAVVLQGQVRGHRHPGTLASRQNLALLFHDRGESELAAREFDEIVASSRTALGPAHPVTLVATNNYCLVLLQLNELDRAAELLIDMLPRCIEQGGENSVYTLTTRDNLGLVQQAKGELAAAEETLRQVLIASEAVHGPKHPYTITRMEHLALCLRDRAQLDAAEPIALAASRAAREELGSEHPQAIRIGQLHAEILYAMGRYEAAELSLRKLTRQFAIARRVVTHRDLERSHFDALNTPHPLLAACLARRGDLLGAWSQLEASFARGLRDEVERRHSRPLLPAERSELVSLSSHLDRVDKQLHARRNELDSTSEEERAEIARLETERESLLARAVAFDAKLASRYDGVRPGSASMEKIASTLRSGTALVAWLSLPASITRPAGSPGGEHWAFVLMPDRAAHCVRLPGSGADGSWTEADARLIRELRERLQQTDAAHVRGAGLVRRQPGELARRLDATHRAAASVRDRFLAPVSKLLAAAAVVEIVAVPSGALSTIPIECLDDRFTVTYTPSGSLYAWLAQRGPASTSGLLAVGDPIANRAGAGRHRSDLGPLPFSRGEIETIAKLCPAPTTILVGQRANEPQIAKLARTGALARYRYIHFATHAVVDEVDPLRSALLLSTIPDTDTVSRIAAGQPYFDEWLTAREIRQSWQLDAELVTLSACRTGVGSGAGLLSFSEALLTAGARAVVVSQWRVDDRATAFLMRRFYENLTVRSQGTSEALREARRWLRTLTNSQVARHTADFTGTEIGPVPSAKHPFAHPYYWAGFVLIGHAPR